jgi:hypothetical protein
MTVCPIAIAVGCRKCPIFRVCPVKGLIGDFKPDERPANETPRSPKAGSGKKRR